MTPQRRYYVTHPKLLESTLLNILLRFCLFRRKSAECPRNPRCLDFLKRYDGYIPRRARPEKPKRVANGVSWPDYSLLARSRHTRRANWTASKRLARSQWRQFRDAALCQSDGEDRAHKARAVYVLYPLHRSGSGQRLETGITARSQKTKSPPPSLPRRNRDFTRNARNIPSPNSAKLLRIVNLVKNSRSIISKVLYGF